MADAKGIAGVLIALTIAASLFAPVASSVNSSTGVQTVTNETVTADVGNYVDVGGYDIDSSTVTVYQPTGSAYETATQSTDYEFNTSDGSIKALSGGDIGDGETLKVSYDYQATDDTTSTVANLVPLFMALLIVGVLAGKITGML